MDKSEYIILSVLLFTVLYSVLQYLRGQGETESQSQFFGRVYTKFVLSCANLRKYVGTKTLKKVTVLCWHVLILSTSE